jgi:hypothetical protein
VTGIALVVNIAQDQIAIERQVVHSNYTSNPSIPLAITLLGSLNNIHQASERDKESEQSIGPIRVALKGDATSERLSKAARSRAAQFPWNVQSFVVTFAKTPAEFDAVVTSSKSPAVLLVDMGYSLSPDAKYLTVSAFAMLSPVSPALRHQQETLFLRHPTQDADRLSPASPLNAMYFNRLAYTKKLDDVGHVSTLREMWLKDEAKTLRDGLEEASAGVIEMLLLDLRQTVAEPSQVLPSAQRFAIGSAEAVRAPDGSLICITN